MHQSPCPVVRDSSILTQGTQLVNLLQRIATCLQRSPTWVSGETLHSGILVPIFILLNRTQLQTDQVHVESMLDLFRECEQHRIVPKKQTVDHRAFTIDTLIDSAVTFYSSSNFSLVAGLIQTLQCLAGNTNFRPTIPFPLLFMKWIKLGNLWNFNQMNS